MLATPIISDNTNIDYVDTMTFNSTINPKKVTLIGACESRTFKHLVQLFNPTTDTKAQKESTVIEIPHV
jgi:hypothetical protein